MRSSNISAQYSRPSAGSQRSYEVRPCGRRHSLRLKCAKCVENRAKAGLERTRQQICPDFRAWIYTRDDFRCVNCKSDGPLCVDHKIPQIRGGKTDPDNLHTLCVSCNLRKGSRSWEDFMEGKYE